MAQPSRVTGSRQTARASRSGALSKSRVPARRPFVIDFHAHVLVPEVVAFAKGHVVDATVPDDPRIPEPARRATDEWRQKNRRKTMDFQERLRDMDSAGVDMQVLTTSIIHQYTYWAEPEAGLEMERLANNRIAEMVGRAPDRFIGLGGAPLQSPQLAARELERCMNELGLRGVQISSTAGAAELGDPVLRPFWAAAERLGAVLYMHPAGVTDARYQSFHLWNSIGQPLEEAMGMASLFHEGVLDAFPKLKICIAHGGGYLPFYAGRVDRNYREKAFIRVQMSKAPSAYMRENFWYDSCIYDRDMLEYLVRKVGASRIVMGSDYPVGEDDPVGFVRSAKSLSAADRELILGGNAAALLGLSI